MTPADHLVLVGMMGVGKSTVGRLLADRWDRPFVDTDEEVERRAGRSVAALFDELGEAGFRRREAEVLRDLLAADGRQVIACGGGVVTGAGNRSALGGGPVVVWLTAPADVLARRVADGAGRPLLGERPDETVAHLLEQRTPLYESVADHVVDTTDRTPDVVADRVAQVAG